LSPLTAFSPFFSSFKLSRCRPFPCLAFSDQALFYFRVLLRIPLLPDSFIWFLCSWIPVTLCPTVGSWTERFLVLVPPCERSLFFLCALGFFFLWHFQVFFPFGRFIRRTYQRRNDLPLLSSTSVIANCSSFEAPPC